MMYYKIINGWQVFSDCRTIQLNGTWISNPSAEQIANAGWLPFTPPIVPPVPQTEPYTADILNAVKKMLSSSTEELSDEDALNVAALFPTWSSKLPKDGELQGEPVVAGDRLWDDGKLWKVVQPHNVMPNWRPADTPALFTEVSIVEWPEFVQPTGAHDAYMAGDKVTFQGQHYISLVNNNTYSPAEYPANWELRP